MLRSFKTTSKLRIVPRQRQYRGVNANRTIVYSKSKRSLATTTPGSPAEPPPHSAPEVSFPCLDKMDKKTHQLLRFSNKDSSGLHSTILDDEIPEPVYARVQSGFKVYKSYTPLLLDYGGALPGFEIAYEHWGQLNEDKSNVILLHTGLSASSHAKSQFENTKPGWWENFIGPNKPLDTNKYFVVCTNVIGGCYGSTGPSSKNPFDDDKRYGTKFPIITLNDMVRAQERLITKGLGVEEVYASVGSSMGGMLSLAYAQEFPRKVKKVVSISACARSHPYSIAMRHTQRQVLMSDPNWKRGFYYDSVPPHVGMKLAREIATVTYRSGPEWEVRFGRERSLPSQTPALCPDFLVETYLDHQGNKFSLEYDPNSLLYISKAMDLFDLGLKNRQQALERRLKTQTLVDKEEIYSAKSSVDSPESRYANSKAQEPRNRRSFETKEESDTDLRNGLKAIADKEVLVIGVKSDILFPHWQQIEIARRLREANIKYNNGDGSNIKHIELGEDISMFGHDTFLLDLEHVGGPLKDFLK